MAIRLFCFVLFLTGTSAAQELATGVVHEKVICQQNATQSYALYLPRGYSPNRRWPILYGFDPFARGTVPIELMKEAAERAGFIVAVSNNSCNGPFQDSITAAQAMWADTHRRFSIDDKQSYATGLSGGARVATTLGQLCGNCLAGVVAQGAGFHPNWPPSEKTQFVLFSTAGNVDFNYMEMVELDQKLEKLRIPHRLRVFAGGHQYAPTEIWDEAFSWLKLQAMRRGLQSRDAGFIGQQLKAGMDRAAALESRGDLADALREYQTLAADFEGLADISAVKAKLADFAQRTNVKEALKAERDAIERQRLTFQKAATDLQIVHDDAEKRDEALTRVQLLASELRKQVRKSKDENAADIVPIRRTLLQILSQSIEMGQQAIRDKQCPLAITYFDFAIEYARAAPLAHFEKARALALAGRQKEALAALNRAVEAGFDDARQIETTAEFAAFKQKPEFQAIIDAARQKH